MKGNNIRQYVHYGSQLLM